MKRRYAQRFLANYEAAPIRIQKAFDKQSALLLNDLRHPSLRAKKYNEAEDIWQARVTRDWRCYFRIEGDTCTFLDIMAHPK